MGNGTNTALSSVQENVQDTKAEERFYCKRFKCDMPKRICLTRQKLMSSKVPPFQKELAAKIRIECADCSQGKELAQEYKLQTPAKKGRLELDPICMGEIESVEKVYPDDKEITEYDFNPESAGETAYIPPEPAILPKTKQCWRCKAHKPLDQFYKYSRSKDGLQGSCKECKGKIDKEYRKKKKKSVKAQGGDMKQRKTRQPSGQPNLKEAEETAQGPGKPKPEKKKTLYDLSSEIVKLRLAYEDLNFRYKVLATQLDNLKLFIETLRIPGNITVQAVADDLESLGAVLTRHEHNALGEVMVPAAMLDGRHNIRFMKQS